MDWTATLLAVNRDDADFDHGVAFEAADWAEAWSYALSLAGQDWMFGDLARTLTAREQRGLRPDESDGASLGGRYEGTGRGT